MLNLENKLENVESELENLNFGIKDARESLKFSKFPMIDDKMAHGAYNKILNIEDFKKVEETSSKIFSSKMKKMKFYDLLSKLSQRKNKFTKKRLKMSQLGSWYASKMENLAQENENLSFTEKFEDVNSVVTYTFKQIIDTSGKIFMNKVNYYTQSTQLLLHFSKNFSISTSNSLIKSKKTTI